MSDTQEFSLYSKEVPRGKRGEVFGIDVPHRVEQLNHAVAATLHSLVVSTPELTYVQAQAEQQAQSTLNAMNTPAIDPRLTTARTRGSDGASITGNYVRPAYTTPVADQHLRPAGSDGAIMTGRPVAPASTPEAQANAEALHNMTGISRTEELAMEANVAADFAQPNEVTRRPETQGPNPDLEAEARYLINQVFGTQEDQHEPA